MYTFVLDLGDFIIQEKGPYIMYTIVLIIPQVKHIHGNLKFLERGRCECLNVFLLNIESDITSWMLFSYFITLSKTLFFLGLT